jgi:hypothetical protein
VPDAAMLRHRENTYTTLGFMALYFEAKSAL